MPNPLDWFFAAERTAQISAIALCLSAVTTVLAIGGFVTAVRSLNATRRQEKRRKPQINFTYLSSSRSDTSSGTEYLFQIRGQNPTDSNNSLSTAELEVRYRLGNGLVSMRIGSSAAANWLTVPAPIPAGSSIEGTIGFLAAKELLDGRRPREFVLHLLDTFGTNTELPVEIVYESREVESEN